MTQPLLNRLAIAIGLSAGLLLGAATSEARDEAAPLRVTASRNVTVSVGSAKPVSLPRRVTRLGRLRLPAAAHHGARASYAQGVLVAQASRGAPPGVVVLKLRGSGCVGKRCGVRILVRIRVRVVELSNPSLSAMTIDHPAPDRLAAGKQLVGGARELVDEVWVGLGDMDAPRSPAQAQQLAARFGAVVSGGLPALGVYQLRWASPQNTAARLAALRSEPSVGFAVPAIYGAQGPTALPSDFDREESSITWPWQMLHADRPWFADAYRGVNVAVLENDTVYDKHPQFTNVSLVGTTSYGWHATHVAGIACAKPDGIKIVGIGRGCNIWSLTWPRDAAAIDQLSFLNRATTPDKHIGVANISYGWNYAAPCVPQSKRDAFRGIIARDAPMFDDFFKTKPAKSIVWVLSAGNNCDQGTDSSFGIDSYKLDNVITVAAVDESGDLWPQSNFGEGVEVAAPGNNIYSTSYDDPWYSGGRATYVSASGTSMAAPFVSGLVSLMRRQYPNVDAGKIGDCVVASAGASTPHVTNRVASASPDQPFVANGLAVIDPEAALSCASHPDAPIITTTSIASGVVGAPYAATLHTADNRNGTWSISRGTLPIGLVLSNTGAISGTPTTSGASSFTVKFVDAAARAAEARYTVTIGDAPVTQPRHVLVLGASPTGAWASADASVAAAWTAGGLTAWRVATGDASALLPPGETAEGGVVLNASGSRIVAESRYHTQNTGCTLYTGTTDGGTLAPVSPSGLEGDCDLRPAGNGFAYDHFTDGSDPSRNGIYYVNAAIGTLIELASDAELGSPAYGVAVSPNGTASIVVTESQVFEIQTLGSAPTVVNLPNGDPAAPFNFYYDTQYALWSNDGRYAIVLTHGQGAAEAFHTLVSIDIQSGIARTISPFGDGVFADASSTVSFPSMVVGSDGQSVIYVARDQSLRSQIWLSRVDGAGSRLLYSSPSLDIIPKLTRSGSTIVFVDNYYPQEPTTLWRIEEDGTGLAEFTSLDARVDFGGSNTYTEADPWPAPDAADGPRIVIAGRDRSVTSTNIYGHPTGGELWSVRTDGTGLQPLLPASLSANYANFRTYGISRDGLHAVGTLENVSPFFDAAEVLLVAITP